MSLGEALKGIVKKIARSTRVDRYFLEEVIRDVQRALLQADVNVRHVMSLTKSLREKILTSDITTKLNVREAVIKTLYDEIVSIIGDGMDIPLKPQKIMLVGLQGSGKTTTAGKLAIYFKNRGLKTGVICADTFRPGAYDQLKQLVEKEGIGFFGIKKEKDAVKIVKEGLRTLKDYNVIIVDTAGRHALEDDLIQEMVQIDRALSPNQRFLVIDAAIGQLAGKQASAFHDAVGLTGIIVTKFDGTAKGGGALSASKETGIPIAFVGTGERLDDFEKFDPERFVSRLLGLGDLKSLLEKAEEALKEEEIDAEAFLKGKFTLKEMYRQLEAMKKMGPVSRIFDMLPFGFSLDIKDDMFETTEEKMKKFRVIMDSMTEEELTNPKIIDGSRIQRIARGSGTSPSEVRELLKYYKTMKNVMKSLRGGKIPLKKLMKRLGV